MTIREKIINALLDCAIDGIDHARLERLSKLSDIGLIDELVNETYSLRELTDETIKQANIENQKLLDIIAKQNTK